VAKILVADDNSNVQKTVALALAELGIEVIAVNNGEAAVKKLPDVMPDLVLADIFMPVRNGYEVCEYVKKDARFAQVPVVLLVGAFDPLDEREAQRVGADGILKKPFVPPDPLIAMVKTLLDRAVGERLVHATVAKPAAAKQNRSGGIAVADDHNPAPAISEEANEEPLTPAPTRMSFEDSEGLVAFSQLLDAPELKASSSHTNVADVDDNEQILTSKRDESLGAPIFWKTESPEQEVKSGDTEPEADESAEIPALSWRLGNESPAAHAEAEAEFKIPDEPLVLVHDEKDEIANQVSTIVEASPLLVQDPATQASLNVEASKAEDLAANPLEWMASVPLPKQEEEAPTNVFEWSPTVPEPTDQIEAKEPEPLEPALELAVAEPPPVQVPSIAPIQEVAASAKSEEVFSIPEPPISAIPESAVLIATQAPAGDVSSVEDTVRSIPKQEWTDLAATLQSKEEVKVSEVAATATTAHEEPKIAEQAEVPSALWTLAPFVSKPAAQNSDDTANSKPKRDWADLVSELKSQAGESKSEQDQTSGEPVQKELSVEAAAPQTAPAPSAPVSKPSSSTEDTARSLPKLDWADLAASIQPRPAETVAESAKPATAAPANASTEVPVNGKSSSISALAAALESSANRRENSSITPTAESQPVPSAGPGTPDPALVEAVVQRVLDKMRPQVVDIITKEFLRPVVQALVHREITKR